MRPARPRQRPPIASVAVARARRRRAAAEGRVRGGAGRAWLEQDAAVARVRRAVHPPASPRKKTGAGQPPCSTLCAPSRVRRPGATLARSASYDDAGGFYDHVVPPHEGVPAPGHPCHVAPTCAARRNRSEPRLVGQAARFRPALPPPLLGTRPQQRAPAPTAHNALWLIPPHRLPRRRRRRRARGRRAPTAAAARSTASSTSDGSVRPTAAAIGARRQLTGGPAAAAGMRAAAMLISPWIPAGSVFQVPLCRPFLQPRLCLCTLCSPLCPAALDRCFRCSLLHSRLCSCTLCSPLCPAALLLDCVTSVLCFLLCSFCPLFVCSARVCFAPLYSLLRFAML
eukprot:SAG11_NODE_565_length_8503_cov_20.810209_2_plen_341_part_00